jgi:hypothetical protein
VSLSNHERALRQACPEPAEGLRANGRKAYFRNNAKLTCLEPQKGPLLLSRQGLVSVRKPEFHAPNYIRKPQHSEVEARVAATTQFVEIVY